MVAAATGPIPATPKSEGAKNCLNAFGAGVFNAPGTATIHTRLPAKRIRVRLAADHLDLHSAQDLLALLEGQPDLLRGQVGDRASDRADVVGDRRVSIWRELNPDCPFHRVALRCQWGGRSYPAAPTSFHSPDDFEIDDTAGIARAQLFERINKELC